MTLPGWFRAYYSHDDPAAQTSNLIALTVGSNGPFYPVYVVAIVGLHSAAPAMLTLLAAPVFLALPWLSRRSSCAARFGLVFVGTANTLWCTKVLGGPSGVELFLLPCVVLAALLFRQHERKALLASAALPLLAYCIPLSALGPPILQVSVSEASRLYALNMASALMLTALLAVQFAQLLRRAAL